MQRHVADTHLSGFNAATAAQKGRDCTTLMQASRELQRVPQRSCSGFKEPKEQSTVFTVQMHVPSTNDSVGRSHTGDCGAYIAPCLCAENRRARRKALVTARNDLGKHLNWKISEHALSQLQKAD